jgi:hypothetical protein
VRSDPLGESGVRFKYDEGEEIFNSGETYLNKTRKTNERATGYGPYYKVMQICDTSVGICYIFILIKACAFLPTPSTH